ncbi:hypothetical protein ACOSP7_009531 [Xanthoceras sorbifolium]
MTFDALDHTLNIYATTNASTVKSLLKNIGAGGTHGGGGGRATGGVTVGGGTTRLSRCATGAGARVWCFVMCSGMTMTSWRDWCGDEWRRSGVLRWRGVVQASISLMLK